MSIFKSAEPKSYEIQGAPLKCRVCEHDEFWHREVQLQTAVATYFNLEWANKSAVCLVCDRCGFIHWFLPK